MKSVVLQRDLLLVFVLVVNSISFEAFSKTPDEQATLYFFTNAACAPCKVVEPEVEKLYGEGFSVMKIDTNLHPDWTQRFNIQKTPTVVLVSKNKIVAQHSGYINVATMRNWFRSIQPARNIAPANTTHLASTSLPRQQPSTVHKGTYHPSNAIERIALQATIKLKIDDPLGTSFATGTVIHSVDGEALVLTCGHVFRDSKGKGKISAEYGFADNSIRVTDGELLFYDSDARDIGLVAISTNENIQPVELAAVDFPVQHEQAIFTIGCDQGDRPSIRRSKVKNTAKYDNVVKYEIYGRPAIGRSGGGMFTDDGKLIGVCNAAVVDVDEGVYVALDTIHWQNKQVNLAHLFNGSGIALENGLKRIEPSPRLAKVDSSVVRNRNFDSIPVRDPFSDSRRGPKLNARNASVGQPQSDSQMELIVVLRDRNAAGKSESWTISNPSSNLIQDLRQQGVDGDPAQSNRFAQLRANMPKLPQAIGKNYNDAALRAQSPR